MAKKKATDILSLIEADHRTAEKIFAEAEGAKGAKKMQECFDQLYKELNLHAYAEELVFYPAMQDHEETQEYIEEAEEEHNSVKILLEEMKSLEIGGSEFKTRMMHLKESIMHHVEEEESEIFEAVRGCMGEEELMELGQEFQAAKGRMEAEVEESLAKR
ncbi:hemerythrin domain-containing protein [Oscillatoria sp. FACHB-1407]|uniref:hemerythrin domain-containing protein n=1 Tax=Oscillatoria sp. FACHB-1407 TaxID=2692847 RepID=UPI00168606A0|nr:hemerythrin domain-containing protein [Oscillatoria sp. FACHB-1407]MBD2460882.1 hemerythrin domain-containing protein [Oscillatoria sp. FACHB-1407]